MIFSEMRWEPRRKLPSFDFVEGDRDFIRPTPPNVPLPTESRRAALYTENLWRQRSNRWIRRRTNFWPAWRRSRRSPALSSARWRTVPKCSRISCRSMRPWSARLGGAAGQGTGLPGLRVCQRVRVLHRLARGQRAESGHHAKRNCGACRPSRTTDSPSPSAPPSNTRAN